jgi:outer membrane protein, heavy metal efflux system
MNLLAALSLGLVSAFLLSGCQHFKSEPLSAAREAATLESRSLGDPHLKDFLQKNLDRELHEWPLARWDFETLTLAAFYFHPSLDVARAQWQTATAGIVTAGARPNPTITLTPEYSLNPPRGVSPWLPSVTFDIPIEIGGKRGHRVARARELSEAARLNIATTAWQVRSRLRLSVLEWNSARQRADLLRQQQSLQEQVIGQLDQRLRAGAISSFELTSARIALAKLQAELEDVGRVAAEARSRAAAAVGIPASALGDLVVDWSFSTLADADFTSASTRARALHARADIAAALAEYDASQSALQLELARQYPDVHLGPGYQWDQGEHKWSLGVSLELPLLNQNQGPIAEARARRSEAAARFEATQAKALAEIDLATASYRGARASVAKLEELVAAQQNQHASVSAHFKAGAADHLELLTAQTELLAAKLLKLDAGTRAMQAVGLLEDAVQQPFAGLSATEVNPRLATRHEAP